MTDDPTKDLTLDEMFKMILDRLTSLETQGEERSSGTRPLLDQIIREMVQTRDTLIERMNGSDARLDRIERQLKVLTQDVMTVRTDQQRLDDRMDDLERRPN